tara:strand:- start:14739 stop:14861 length:123 start_codon:yes stop_codon:yes gene_type:complete
LGAYLSPSSLSLIVPLNLKNKNEGIIATKLVRWQRKVDPD